MYKKQTKHIMKAECLHQIGKFLAYLKLPYKCFTQVLLGFFQQQIV